MDNNTGTNKNLLRILNQNKQTKESLERKVTEPIEDNRKKVGNVATGGLTAKEERFARNVADGMTYSDAYRDAYDCENATTQTINKNACKVMAKDHVKGLVRQILSAKEHDALHDSARMRNFVLEKLQYEATNADTAGARVRALELLGKIDIVQLFTPQVISDDREENPEKLRQELQTRLKRLIKPAE